MPAVKVFGSQDLATNAADELIIAPRSLSAALHTAATVAANGAEASLTGQGEVLLILEGTSSDFSVVVEGQVSGSTSWYALEAVSRPNLDIISVPLTVRGAYAVSVLGFAKLRARIASVTGGNLTVLARA